MRFTRHAGLCALVAVISLFYGPVQAFGQERAAIEPLASDAILAPSLAPEEASTGTPAIKPDTVLTAAPDAKGFPETLSELLAELGRETDAFIASSSDPEQFAAMRDNVDGAEWAVGKMAESEGKSLFGLARISRAVWQGIASLSLHAFNFKVSTFDAKGSIATTTSERLRGLADAALERLGE